MSDGELNRINGKNWLTQYLGLGRAFMSSRTSVFEAHKILRGIGEISTAGRHKILKRGKEFNVIYAYGVNSPYVWYKLTALGQELMEEIENE